MVKAHVPYSNSKGSEGIGGRDFVSQHSVFSKADLIPQQMGEVKDIWLFQTGISATAGMNPCLQGGCSRLGLQGELPALSSHLLDCKQVEVLAGAGDAGRH